MGLLPKTSYFFENCLLERTNAIRMIARKIKNHVQGIAAIVLRVNLIRLFTRLLLRALRLDLALGKRLPVIGEFHFEQQGMSCKYRSSFYDGVGRILYWSGFQKYEPETLKVFCELAKKSNTVMDIGANTGLFTLAAKAANPEAAVHAFEPVPEIFNQFSYHCSANALNSGLVLNNIALSKEPGLEYIHIPYESMGSATLVQGGINNLRGKQKRISVTSLDEYVSNHRIKRIDLIKIDVEGHEFEVLQGATRTLSRDSPNIICECLPIGDNDSTERLLHKIGYLIYWLTRSGPQKVGSLKPTETGEFHNFLFTKKTL